MIPLIALSLLLAVLLYLGRAGSRPLAERIVDALYSVAHVAAAVAHAADVTLCEYRAQTATSRAQYAREAGNG